MGFLNEHVFSTPDWLLDKEILRRIEHAGALDRVKNLQSRMLNDVMGADVMIRLNEAHTFDGDDAYAPLEMLEDLRRGVWSEIYEMTSIDPYRRNLQRVYLDNIENLFNTDEIRSFRGNVDVKNSDIRAFLRVELGLLENDLERAQTRISDGLTRAHIEDALIRIDDILDTES
jgi:hypothetical protein